MDFKTASDANISSRGRGSVGAVEKRGSPWLPLVKCPVLARSEGAGKLFGRSRCRSSGEADPGFVLTPFVLPLFGTIARCPASGSTRTPKVRRSAWSASMPTTTTPSGRLCTFFPARLGMTAETPYGSGAPSRGRRRCDGAVPSQTGASCVGAALKWHSYVAREIGYQVTPEARRRQQGDRRDQCAHGVKSLALEYPRTHFVCQAGSEPRIKTELQIRVAVVCEDRRPRIVEILLPVDGYSQIAVATLGPFDLVRDRNPAIPRHRAATGVAVIFAVGRLAADTKGAVRIQRKVMSAGRFGVTLPQNPGVPLLNQRLFRQVQVERPLFGLPDWGS